jgi:glutamyl-tRNA synthetase
MTVVTRFAPSPTGFLHIGGARTALFNYLFAKKHGGRFLLRIEDTDKERSKQQATDAILSSLKWLNIKWDKFSEFEDEVHQSKRILRHQEIALELLRQHKAYKCFTTSEEIQEQKDKAINANTSFLFTSKWRDATSDQHPDSDDYVIRFKTPKQGATEIDDMIHGKIVFQNNTIEDFALLKHGGDPLYNLCACVDDHDMGITHIIRGQDHITNAARQILLYQAMDWQVPNMAHIPLIHGQDGAKLSKRHGATNVEEYKILGYLPEALVNYILRLGWSYAGDEIISLEQAAKIFDTSHIGKSCARLDFDKLNNVNAIYIKTADNKYLTDLVTNQLTSWGIVINSKEYQMILAGMDSLKLRAQLIGELAQHAKIYLQSFLPTLDTQGQEVIRQTEVAVFQKVITMLQGQGGDAHRNNLQNAFKALAQELGLKLGELMMPIRLLITGQSASPSVFEIIEIIGIDLAITRIMAYELLK